jgi:Zn-dependent protease
MFFVGGYVTINGILTPLQSALISVAGPLTNLILYLIAISMIKFKLIDRKHFHTLEIVSRINLFLFAFNLIPLPGFDGYNFFSSLLRVIF